MHILMHSPFVYHEFCCFQLCNCIIFPVIIYFRRNTKSHVFILCLYREIVPALQHALEWVYQFVNFEKSDHFLFRQCASSLIALWGCQHTIMQFSTDKLQLCFSKWFTAAMKCSSYEVIHF